MGKSKKVFDYLDEKLSLSRRSFVKGAAAIGFAGTLAGCSKDNGGDPIYIGQGGGNEYYSEDIYNSASPVYRYGTSAHNCGGRCLLKAQVVNGKIVRFLSAENNSAWDGREIDPENRNNSQYRPCSRCRSYKFRLYHAGRLKYPLKQTVKRGQLDGFMRISWTRALEEIAAKKKAITGAYGFESFLSLYGCGNTGGNFQGSSYGVFANFALFGMNFSSAAIRLLGDSVPFANDYSFHQYLFMGGSGELSYAGLTPADSMAMAGKPIAAANDFADKGKTIILWGSNVLTTGHPESYSWIRAIEDMKKRDQNASVIYIGPEFSDTGITLADKWIRSRPYTDVAFIMAMLYEMLINTFDENGVIKANPWLDVDYIDAMVYGFFDSPEYWKHKTTHEISMTDPSSTDYTKVDAVKPGESLAAYIMGDDSRLTLADYNAGKTYIAKQFTTGAGGSGTSLKRSAATTYSSKPNSKYKYKRDLGVKKDAEWASKITKVPASVIREVARLYTDPAKAPVWTEFIGGQLKQADGCVTYFALQALCIITKNWGKTACGMARNAFVPVQRKDPSDVNINIFNPTTWASIKAQGTSIPSATQWHNAVRFAFRKELKENGYTPNIPDFDDWETNVYYDDGGTKTLIRWDRKADGTVDTYDEGGRTFFKWYKKDEGRPPEYVGFRFILNSGGNMAVNQNMNTTESTKMFECLPFSPNTPDPDAFCLVTFDNFMSPSARWSDYVLPAKTTWEQEDYIALKRGNSVYIDNVIEKAPGESLSTWDFAREWLNAEDPSGANAEKFTGLTKDSTFKDVVKKVFAEKITVDPVSPHYGKTWDEFVEKPYTVNSPDISATVTEKSSPERAALDAYLVSNDIGTTPLKVNIPTIDANSISYGLVGDNHYTNPELCPNQSGRFHVFSGSIVWRYENQFNKWHGWTQHQDAIIKTKGQTNKDDENDRIVYPIPMYFAYEDYFVDAYGLSGPEALNGRFTLTTSHDRYRAHSSHAENPLTRELTHRTAGGKIYSCDDSGSYADAKDHQEVPDGAKCEFFPLNNLIGNDGTEKQGASYSEIWIHKDNDKGISDGDLVDVWNEIGAVRCVARTSVRCVPGFLGLHEGCWYDPREIENRSPHRSIDVGGCCNTLMATRPSRIDKGNAQQSAMVDIAVFRKASEIR